MKLRGKHTHAHTHTPTDDDDDGVRSAKGDLRVGGWRVEQGWLENNGTQTSERG